VLKVIQVGIGGFGRCRLDTIKRNNSVATHAALVDIDEGVLKEKAEAYGVPAERCFTRLDDALDKVDAVVCVSLREGARGRQARNYREAPGRHHRRLPRDGGRRREDRPAACA